MPKTSSYKNIRDHSSIEIKQASPGFRKKLSVRHNSPRRITHRTNITQSRASKQTMRESSSDIISWLTIGMLFAFGLNGH